MIQTHIHSMLHYGPVIVNIRTLIRHGKRKPDRLTKKPMTRVLCGNRDLPSRYTGTRLTDNRQPVRIIIRPLRSLFHNHDQDATTDLPRKFETEEFSWTGILEGSQILKESIDVFRAQLFGQIDILNPKQNMQYIISMKDFLKVRSSLWTSENPIIKTIFLISSHPGCLLLSSSLYIMMIRGIKMAGGQRY